MRLTVKNEYLASIYRMAIKTFPYIWTYSCLIVQPIKRKFQIILFESMCWRSWHFKNIRTLTIMFTLEIFWNFRMATPTFSWADSSAHWKPINSVRTVHVWQILQAQNICKEHCEGPMTTQEKWEEIVFNWN